MTSTEIVHVPAQGTVYDTTTFISRAFRVLNRVRRSFVDLMNSQPHVSASILKFAARYRYKARHRFTEHEDTERAVRERDATGQIVSETRIVTPALPTLRERIKSARIARRTYAPSVKHGTGAFPIVVQREGEDTWSWLTADEWSRKKQREINNSTLLMTGAEGPLPR